MDMITVEVVQKFRDAHTSDIYTPGTTIEVTSERLAEIMAVNVHLVRVVEQNDGEDTDDAAETTAPEGEDAETGDDETETPSPEGEDKPKARCGRKPANYN